MDRLIAIPLLLALALSGCAHEAQRPAASTLGCAEAVVDSLPSGLTDPEKHCLASAGIARQCSNFEAWLAGWGKEVRDAFGAGDAAWEDLVADRLGRRCAAQPVSDDDLIECCRRALAGPTD